MINIKDIDEIKTSKINSYGYFSMGSIEVNTIGHSSWMENPLYGLVCWCFVEDQKFQLFLYKVGVTDRYLVLSDFSSIPDMAVLNSEDILEKLKIEVDEYFKSRFVDYDKANFNGFSGTIGELAHAGINQLGNLKINQPYIAPYGLSPTDGYITYGTSSLNSLSSAASKIN